MLTVPAKEGPRLRTAWWRRGAAEVGAGVVAGQPVDRLYANDKRSFRNVHVVHASGGESHPVSFLANGETGSRCGRLMEVPTLRYGAAE